MLMSHITTAEQAQLFQAKLVQLAGTAILNAAMTGDSTQLAQGLANVVNVAFGLIDAELPYVVEVKWEKHVELDQEKAISQLLKGFFTTYGFTNLTQANATSQCILDVVKSIKTVVANPVLARGDRFTASNSFLDSITVVADGFERCKKLDTVELTLLKSLGTLLEKHTAEALFTMVVNTISQRTLLTQSEINMGVYFFKGRYEVAGQLFATHMMTVFNGLLF